MSIADERAQRSGGSSRERRVDWVVTTQDAPWVTQPAIQAMPSRGYADGLPDVLVQLDAPQQRIDGIGACFNELGWTALMQLPSERREAVLHELFTPGAGAGLTLCRTPIGANDFSTDWYSYDETDGDFALDDFSIEHDRDALLPFITAAKRYQPSLRLWASPWSPPTWMKTNKHYAGAQAWASGYENDLGPEQVGREGTDMFILEDRYLQAYARYFARFIETYRAEGVDVEMVMPQNEFNSPQPFPSCTWTPEGLARFLTVLGPEMQRLGVQIFFGTQERPDPAMLEAVLADPTVASFVSGAGFQWAGKGAIAATHHNLPSLRLYQTEQECGDGKNDWRYARYTWSLMKHFLGNGAEGYMYWNMALQEGGVSRWGWAQNSLVVVDPETHEARFSHDYSVLKHLSHFLRPGARRVETLSFSGFENQLAFVNSDGSIVIVTQNDLAEELPIRFTIGDIVVAATLPADSFNTLVVRP